MWSRRRNGGIALLAGCVALAFVPALAGLVARPDKWYRRLRKPPLQPPAFIFAPVWTILYLSIGLAHYRFLSTKSNRDRSAGNALYALQLSLNAAWTPLFFGLRAPRLALADLMLLLAAASATEQQFRRVSTDAARLFLPYLGWLTFASYLNGGICALNPASTARLAEPTPD